MMVLSKKGNLYKDALETCLQLGDYGLAQELFTFFVDKVIDDYLSYHYLSRALVSVNNSYLILHLFLPLVLKNYYCWSFF